MSDFNSDSEETEQRDNRLKLRAFFTLFFEGDFLPMNELNISAVDATAMETATTTSAPKHKWLCKLTRGAKKATMFATVVGVQCQQLKRYWHLPRIKNQIEYLGQNTLR